MTPPVESDGRPGYDRQVSYAWHDRVCYEAAVVLALQDLCVAGDVVFDIGANVGVISIAASRLVGPRGVVCAFEASPRIVGLCQRNLADNGCGNTQLFNRALYSTSGALIPIYEMSELNDTISVKAKPLSVGAKTVETLALDDFVAATGLTPTLIKSDIEGAEYDMLRGASSVLSDVRPHLVIEQQRNDDRCLKLLGDFGYRGMDLNSYQWISTREDYQPYHTVRNVLFAHESRIDEIPWRRPLQTTLVGAMNRAEAKAEASATSQRSAGFKIPPGRYLACFDIDSAAPERLLTLGVSVAGRHVARYSGPPKTLAGVCDAMPVALERDAEIKLYVQDKKGAEREFRAVRGFSLLRVDSFNAERASRSAAFLY